MRTTFAGLLHRTGDYLTAAAAAFQRGDRRAALGNLGRAVEYLRLARPLATTPVHVALCERRMESVNTLLTEHGYSRVDAPEFTVLGGNVVSVPVDPPPKGDR